MLHIQSQFRVRLISETPQMQSSHFPAENFLTDQTSHQFYIWSYNHCCTSLLAALIAVGYLWFLSPLSKNMELKLKVEKSTSLLNTVITSSSKLTWSPNIDTGWCNNSGGILKGNPTAICQACSCLCSLLCCIYLRDVFIYQNLMNDFFDEVTLENWKKKKQGRMKEREKALRALLPFSPRVLVLNRLASRLRHHVQTRWSF